MDFSHLDDDTPPHAEPTMITDIAASASRRQRIRRGVFTSVAAVCTFAIGIGVVSAINEPTRKQRVSIVGNDGSPSTATEEKETSSIPTTSTPEATTTTAVDPNVWVTVEIQLDQLQVQQGHDLTGTVIFNNKTSQRVTFADDNGCVKKWHAFVTEEHSRPTSWAETLECAGSPASTNGYTDFPPGITRVPFRAITLFQICSGDSCPKALPVGPANLWFVGPSEHMALPDAEPITITKDAPGTTPEFVMPSVVNTHIRPATSTIFATGFSHICWHYEANANVEMERVIRQTPAPGSSVSSETKIELVVSSGTASARTDIVCSVT